MYNKTLLDNGLTIITESMGDVRSVTIGIWIKIGSRYEHENTNGISHFLEHMLFKGTQKHTAQDIAEAIDSVGGTLNAATSREYTLYYVKVLDEHFNLGLDLLADIILYSTFPEEELEKEKQVVLEEIRMGEDTPDDYIYDVFMENIWPENPLGWPVIGRRQTIQTISRDQLINFYQTNYHASNIIISIAGNIDHDQAVKSIKRYFGNINPKESISTRLPSEITSKKVLINKDLEQVHFFLGTKGLPFNHKDRYSAYLLNSILGGPMSSRLFQKVREQKGLVYSISSYLDSYLDTGIFAVYAGCNKKTFTEVVRLILKEFKALKEVGATNSELQRAKEQLKGHIILSLESTNNRMHKLAKQEIYFGKYFSLDETIKAIQQVRLDDLHKVAVNSLNNQYLTLAAIGPINNNSLPKDILQC